MKGQLCKTGHGEEATTALLASCSTPTCVFYLTLTPRSRAAAELTSLEMMEATNVIGSVRILPAQNALGRQTRKLLMP